MDDLNGWQRLFVLFLALSVLAAGAVMVSAFPDRSDTGAYTVYACDLSIDAWDVTPAAAAFYLRNGTIPAAARGYAGDPPRDGSIDPECRKQLTQIAAGTRYRHLLWGWLVTCLETVGWLAGGAYVVYLLGSVLGWVWRGFFPRKPAV
jgi:hypothetical protein